jgi:hypothetical protein
MMHAWDTVNNTPYDQNSTAGTQFSPKRWAYEQRAVRTENEAYMEMGGGGGGLRGTYDGISIPNAAHYGFSGPWGPNVPIFHDAKPNAGDDKEAFCSCDEMKKALPWGGAAK